MSKYLQNEIFLQMVSDHIYTNNNSDSTLEEIFIDYGNRYNRDNYNKTDEKMKEQILLELERENDRISQSKMQSIVANDNNDSDGIKFDQDTTVSGGFLDKLSRKDTTFNKAGILSPNEALKQFSELGTTMFGGEEDREIIESMTGKKTIPKVYLKDNSFETKLDKKKESEDIKSYFANQASDIKIEEDDDFDPFDPSSLFGIKKSKPRVNNNETKTSNPLELFKPTINNDIVELKPLTQTVLSPEEAMSLTNKIDNMSEEQIQLVFKKLRESMKDKLKNETKESSQNEMVVLNENLKPTENLVMPRAPIIDPKVRAKYNNDLKSIEDELEKIYQNPLSVWKELLQDPDKYLDDDEIKEIERLQKEIDDK